MNDPETSSQASIDFRDELLAKNWPDDQGVAELTGVLSGPEAGQYASRARAAGELLGVWCAPRRAFIYPDFQFDRWGKPRPHVAELLAILPYDEDRGGWRCAFWLYSPHAYLDNQLPAEVFARDPAWVLRVARDQFSGDRDAGW
jgi:hypothetical protein